jgi:DNA-binding NtrC family response regulator
MGLVRSEEPEVILLDLTMPHLAGAELLARIHESHPYIPVIVVTGTNEVRAAVSCMKAGAFDYMVKAVEESRLVSGVSRAIEIRRLKRDYSDLKSRVMKSELSSAAAFSEIVTQNSRMKSIFLLLESIAKTKEPVLIIGETGVGKNLIARAIHRISGREGPYVEVNVAGLDDTMFSDSLFGHKKGAFTGATESRNGLVHRAGQGTLFLDEIGDLVLSSQVKLLRLLDSREYYPLGSDLAKRSDARVVVATNRDLVSRMEKDQFRKDLYYRLSTYEISIPPLRMRTDDLPLLINLFLQEAADTLGRKKPPVPPELLTLLETYHFPGNIRELRSMIFDAVTKHSSGTLSLKPFKTAVGLDPKRAIDREPDKLLIFTEKFPTLKQADALVMAEAIKRARGNQSLAAGLLGISRQALSKRLARNEDE